MGALKGVAFDLDGVLWDSSDAHEEAFRLAFDEIGIPLPQEFYGGVAGLRTEDAVRQLLEVQGDPEGVFRVSVIAEAKRKYARRLLLDRVQPAPGADLVLATARGLGLRVALVTGASAGTVNVFLQKLGQTPFEAIVSAGDDVPGKPDPAPYLLAARRLNVAPRECLAVEDSGAGILSARRAGMGVVQLVSHGVRKPPLHGARRVAALWQVAEVLQGLAAGGEHGR